jgi:hypothetical protein
MDQQQRHKILRSVMWDYNIPESEIEKLLDGKIDKAGHYTRETLFAKMLTSLSWYTIIRLIPAADVKKLLSDKVIEQIWPRSVQKQYRYVKQRLQEALPDTR